MSTESGNEGASNTEEPRQAATEEGLKSRSFPEDGKSFTKTPFRPIDRPFQYVLDGQASGAAGAAEMHDAEGRKDTFVDEQTTPLLYREIERATLEQWSDMTLPDGTVLNLSIKEKNGTESGGRERSYGNIRLGSDLRVGIGSFSMNAGGTGFVEFTPSSDREGELRRQTAKVFKQSEPLRVKDLMGEDLTADEEAERDRLQQEVDRLNKEVNAENKVSTVQFVEDRKELLRKHGVDPEKVLEVKLTAQTHPFGVETPPRLNKEMHEPPPANESVKDKERTLLEEALNEVDRAKQGLENAAAYTIENAVNGLRFDKHGKEEHLTPEQVQDVLEAFGKASAARLSPDARKALIDELVKVPDGIVPFSPRPELVPPKNIVKQGG
jgi:hypothetical protein